MQGKAHLLANVAMKEMEGSLVVDDEQGIYKEAAKETTHALCH